MKIVRKPIAFFLVLLMLAAPLSAYAANGASLQASAFQNVNGVEGLSLKADQKSYSPYALSLTLTLRNKTRCDYEYGAKYYLEKYADGQWCTLLRNVEFPAVGFTLFAKSSLKDTLIVTDDGGVYSGFGQIEPGKYRVVLPMTAVRTNETVCLAAEFLVEDTFLYAKEPVNLRTGPSAKHALIRELLPGERVSYIRKSGKWALVRVGTQTGYVYAKYLVKTEADCYYSHFAVEALRASGVKNPHVVGIYAVTTHDGYTGRGDVRFDCDSFVSVTWKKPYTGSISIMIYPDEAAAKKKFAEIANAQKAVLDGVDYSYFYSGRYIVYRCSGGLSEFEPSHREQAFNDKLEKNLKRMCEKYIGYLGN